MLLLRMVKHDYSAYANLQRWADACYARPSLAAAHVSGLIALLLERHPQASAETVRDTIIATAHDLGPDGFDVQFGAGRADAHASLKLLATGQ